MTDPPNPFPGLRPFIPDEAELFFGRDRQCDELVRRLAGQRFLAVVGTSGSGKSSLVKAGLLPALQGGLLAAAGSRWRMATLRPQDDPIDSLARALAGSGAYAATGMSGEDAAVVIETTLRRSGLGLVEATRLARLPEHENLLVLVDQFEELFRYADLARARGTGDDAPAFVRLLLEAAAQRELPVYVVITMRSDFLGDCARFRDLPEAVSTSQYLIPRLTRDELRSVITGPVGVRGAAIDPALVQRLLNEVGDDPDQLPVLQHALHRSWDRWAGAARPIAESDLDAAGGMARALSQHAEEAYAALASNADRLLASRLFKRLSEREPNNREIRRPTPVAELAAVAGVQPADVVRVVDVFRAPGRSFLMPPYGTPLKDDEPVDISHESLIRQWDRLRQWVEEEAESRATYQQLVYDARLQRAGRGGLWGEPDLSRGRQWLQREAPNPDWARRYGPGLEDALAFMRESEAAFAAAQARERHQVEAENLARQRDLEQAQALARAEKQRGDEQVLARSKQRRLNLILLAVLFVTAVVCAWGWLQSQRARDALSEVQVREHAAVTARFVAVSSTTRSIDPELSVLIALKGLESRTDLTSEQQGSLADALSGSLSVSRLRARELVGDGSKKLRLVAFSADGTMLATEGTGREVLFREAHTLKPSHPPLVLKGDAQMLRFAPAPLALQGSATAQEVLAVAYDSTIGLFVAGETTARRTLIHDERLVGFDFSADGQRMATVQADGQIALWSLPSGSSIPLKATFKHLYGTAIGLSPDGNQIATAGGDGSVKLWNIRTGEQKELRKSWDERHLVVRFSPNGRYLATGGLDSLITLWDPASGKKLRTVFGHFNTVFDIAFSADSRRLISASADSTLRVHDPETGRLIHVLRGHKGPVEGVSFGPDQDSVASVGWDGTLRVWSVRGLLDVAGHTAFSADGERLITANADGTVPVWNAATGDAVLYGLVHDVNAVALSADGALTGTGNRRGEVSVWRGKQQLHTMTGHGASDPVMNIEFSADGKRLASVSKSWVFVWDIETGKRLRQIQQDFVFGSMLALNSDGSLVATADQSGEIRLWQVGSDAAPRILSKKSSQADVRLAFSSNKRWLAAASNDGNLRVWAVDKPADPPLELQAIGDYLFSVAFDASGMHLVAGSMDRSATIWDLNRPGGPPVRLKGHTAAIEKVGFSRDGRRVFTASWDHSARIWNATDGSLLATLTHDREVKDAAFSGDGKRLTTVTSDGTPRVHLFGIEQLKERARARVTRTLTAEECALYLRGIPCQ